VQAVLADEVRAYAREVTLVAAGEAIEEQRRDREVQHRVAEELEPLVVLGAVAAVRERAHEQARLREAVPEPRLQRDEAGIGAHVGVHGSRALPRYFSSR
jgi:hypothetical protein